MEITLPNFSLSEILKRLMFEKNIRAMDLARQTKLPQPTIQRIVAGTTTNPHYSSLAPIAKFFGITVAQLKGEEKISWLHLGGMPGLIQVPILSAQQAKNWVNKTQIDAEQIWIDNKYSQETYAIITADSSMYPLFPQGTLLLIDPIKSPKDRSYVLVSINDHDETIFRQLLIDGNHQYLKPLNSDLDSFPMTKFDPKKDYYCGVMVHSRRDFDDKQ